MKYVYFVRHGETESNITNVRQDGTPPLTERGRQQAAFIAERCTNLPIEAIVASPMVRTRETAERIAESIKLPIEYSDLFVEHHVPSELIGLLRDDPKLQEVDRIILEHIHDPAWHHSDEENFFDLKKRALEGLRFLGTREETHTLVVTHGFFMRVLIAAALFGEELTPEVFQPFARTFHMANTGLSIFGYDETKENPWWLWVWNDHAHLAD